MIFAFDGYFPEIGEGTYVSETATVIGNVKIGNNCYIGHGSILRGDYGRIEIGSGTAVEEGVIIHAMPGETSTTGDSVTFGHGAIIHSHEIGDLAVIGMGAILSLGSSIGTGAIVAEGAVVKMNQEVSENVMVAGAPAKVIRDVNDKDIQLWTAGKQVYVDLAKKYLDIGMQKISE